MKKIINIGVLVVISSLMNQSFASEKNLVELENKNIIGNLAETNKNAQPLAQIQSEQENQQTASEKTSNVLQLKQTIEFLKFADGAEYQGQRQNGMFNGLGLLKLTDGSQYEGGFKDNRFHGEGEYTSAKGDKYICKFLDGEPIGKLRLLLSGEKEYIEGNIENGEFVPLQPNEEEKE